MVDLSLIEQRLATLEQEVAEMKKQLVPSGRRVNWVDEFAGSMKEFPAFSEVVRLGRELRQRERIEDGDDARA